MDRQRMERDFRRCQEAIHAAETMLAETLYAESISRAYYAAIHAVMMLLAAGGAETYLPEEAERLFTPEFVERAGMERELATLFEEVRRARKSAAHYFLVKYSGEEVTEALRRTRRLLELTRRRLGLPD